VHSVPAAEKAHSASTEAGDRHQIIILFFQHPLTAPLAPAHAVFRPLRSIRFPLRSRSAHTLCWKGAGDDSTPWSMDN